MSQEWTRSEIEEYAIQPCQPLKLLFCKQNWHALCFTFGVELSTRVSLLHVLLPSLVLVSLAKLLPQNIGIFEHFPNLDFFYWYVRWWLDENYSLLCLLFGRGGPLPLRTASNAAMFSFLMSLLSITFLPDAHEALSASQHLRWSS